MGALDITGIGALSSLVEKGLEKFFPDKAKLAEATNALITPILAFIQEAVKHQAAIIIAEAQGESWLQRNWRPLVMINFAVLLNAYWFGFAIENLAEAERLALFDIIKLGLGGYVIGRSGEKIAESLAPAIASWKAGK